MNVNSYNSDYRILYNIILLYANLLVLSSLGTTLLCISSSFLKTML